MAYLFIYFHAAQLNLIKLAALPKEFSFLLWWRSGKKSSYTPKKLFQCRLSSSFCFHHPFAFTVEYAPALPQPKQRGFSKNKITKQIWFAFFLYLKKIMCECMSYADGFFSSLALCEAFSSCGAFLSIN